MIRPDVKLDTAITVLKAIPLVLGMLVTIVITVAFFIGLPVLLLWAVMSPLFGPDPIGDYLSGLRGLALIGAGLAVIGAIFWAAVTFEVVGRIVVLVIVVAALAQCFDGRHHYHCTPSRYIEC